MSVTHEGTMTSERPPIPTEERKPTWRRACLAYREMRQAGASDQEAHEAADATVQQALPLSCLGRRRVSKRSTPRTALEEVENGALALATLRAP